MKALNIFPLDIFAVKFLEALFIKLEKLPIMKLGGGFSSVPILEEDFPFLKKTVTNFP